MAISLVEFVVPLREAPQREQCLGVLYFLTVYGDNALVSVADLRVSLRRARIPNAAGMNIARALSAAGHYVDAAETNDRGQTLWRLTDSGMQHMRRVLGLPHEQTEIAHDVNTLQAVAKKISDPVSRAYVEEAILCLSVDALKAATVFLWSGAIRKLQEDALAKDAAGLNAAIQRHDSRAKPVSKVEDMAQIKDTTALLAMRDIGLIDKGQWMVLGHALDLRNQCGHPSKYNPGPKKAAAFIEDLVGIVFN
jgi:hypothetical protein